jgi:hypothetical protein
MGGMLRQAHPRCNRSDYGQHRRRADGCRQQCGRLLPLLQAAYPAPRESCVRGADRAAVDKRGVRWSEPARRPTRRHRHRAGRAGCRSHAPRKPSCVRGVHGSLLRRCQAGRGAASRCRCSRSRAAWLSSAPRGRRPRTGGRAQPSASWTAPKNRPKPSV